MESVKYLALLFKVWAKTPKFPKLLKKIYLKYSYKFETLVPFKVQPLQQDAVTPVLLPLPETVPKIFDRNAVKGH